MPSIKMEWKVWFIRRHGAFFRPDAQGYTYRIEEAGLFLEDDARGYLDVDGVTIHRADEYLPMIRRRRAELFEAAGRMDAMARIATAMSEAP